MPVDHQPTFSRTSLNILILVCVVLILIFGQSTQEDTHIDLPPAPKLDVSIWQTDSGSTVWFSPLLDENVYIQLHYHAGFAFNQAAFPAGTSQILTSLLTHQANTLQLPVQFKLTPDFIEVAIKLSNDALRMRQQIKQISALLYQPTLNSQAFTIAKQVIPNRLDTLWQAAYANHPYEGPKQGNNNSLTQLDHGQVRQFHQRFMHPKRLSASIVGNLNEQAAQIIMESLLPNSAYSASNERLNKTQTLGTYQQGSVGLVVLPGSYDAITNLAKQSMMLAILKRLQPTQMQWVDGTVNNSLLVEQWPSLISAMDTDLNSDIMRQAKRQSIQTGIQQTQSAQALSEFLAWLNRYHLPSNFLHKQFEIIDQWQDKDWQALKQDWLLSPMN